MPKHAVIYQNTVIYKIVCNDLQKMDIYVGHTTNFVSRKRQHKECCTNTKSKNYNLFIYKTIRENGEWNNWSMIEIEKYPCKDANEARARERFWYEKLNANLNTLKPYREDLKEWRLEHIKEKQAYDKQRRLLQYDDIITREREYRKNNSEKIKEYKQQTRICECGSTYKKNDSARHMRSLKHQNYELTKK